MRALGLAPPTWPARLRDEPRERLSDYCLRLSQQGFIPTILAGLNGPKARYLEIVNPLASHRVVRAARSLPPRLARPRRGYRASSTASIRSSPTRATPPRLPVQDLLFRPDMVELVVRELVSPDIERVLPGDGSLALLTAMCSAARGSSWDVRGSLKALAREAGEALPTRLAVELAPPWRGPESLPAVKLAFRAMLASRTIDLFEADARAFAERARSSGRDPKGAPRQAAAAPFRRSRPSTLPRAGGSGGRARHEGQRKPDQKGEHRRFDHEPATSLAAGRTRSVRGRFALRVAPMAGLPCLRPSILVQEVSAGTAPGLLVHPLARSASAPRRVRPRGRGPGRGARRPAAPRAASRRARRGRRARPLRRRRRCRSRRAAPPRGRSRGSP